MNELTGASAFPFKGCTTWSSIITGAARRLRISIGRQRLIILMLEDRMSRQSQDGITNITSRTPTFCNVVGVCEPVPL